MHYILAVDGGGTKTKVVCCDQQGNAVGEGISGPTNLTATSVGAASFNLREGIRQATEQLPTGWTVTKMVMGLAGMDTDEEHDNAVEVFSEVLGQYPIAEFELVNDIVIALASGTDKQNAVALIAGTGSNCYGRNEQGQEKKVGGMDFLLTDQGSGYAIGRAVLRAAVKSYDGRAEHTLLEDLVQRHFQVSTLKALKNKVYNPLISKPEVAALSPICVTAFEQGDQTAKQILEYQTSELYNMISTVLLALKIDQTNVDIVFTGGVNQISYVVENLRQKLTALAPQSTLIIPKNEPVYGAIRLALSA